MASGGSKAITTAFIEILPNFQGFAKALGTGFDLAFGSVAATVADSMENAGKAMFKKFTLPLLIATGANIAQFQALEREVNTVITLFGTAETLLVETFDEMSEGVRGVAQEVGGLEKDIAGGLYQAISAGVPKDSVFAFLEVAQMAAMADKTADLEVAVDGITTAVNAFASENLSAARASDIMFAGVAAGKTTFGELGSSIGRAAGLAANAGVHFDEFTAVIAQMTKSGIKTSEAVSYMRASITSILRPSEDMNAIFQEIGFATAEAAVPVIGLQASFQTLVDATGGSTSKLQELLGSAEAVSTVLAVTGDNADSFSATLKTMETSAGSTERAYNIMERGIGRSFGRLTEGFDQLGNMFGEMGSELAQPVVDALADIVGALVGIFSTLKPLAITVGAAIQKFMDILALPIVNVFVKGLVAMALAISGVLGVLAPFLLLMAKLIQFKVYAAAIKLMRARFIALKGTIDAFRATLAQGGVVARAFGAGLDKLAVAFNFLKSTVLGTMGAIAVSFAAFAIAALAIYGVVKAFTAMREAAQLAAEQNDVFGDGVSRLMENAGIVENALPRAFQLTEDAIGETQQANFRLLNELKETQETVGDLGAADALINIGTSMVWKGATPAEAYEQIQLLADIRGIQIPLGLEGFAESTKSVEQSFKGIEVYAQEVGLNFDAAIAKGKLLGEAVGDADIKKLTVNLAEALIIAEQTGDVDVFKEGLAGIEESIGSAQVFADVLKGVFIEVENIEDKKLGIELRDTHDVESFFGELDRIGRIPEEDLTVKVGIDTDLAKDLAVEDMFAQLAEGAVDSRVLLEGEAEAIRDLANSIDEPFQAALDSITNTNAQIISSIESQIPVFSEYEAAVATSVAAIHASATDWATDLDVVTEGTKTLGEHLTPAEIVIFNSQSVAEQASFFKGVTDAIGKQGEDGVAAVDQMWTDIKTLMQTGDLGEATIASQMETTMAAAETVLNESMNAMLVEAEAKGIAVPAAFLTKFNAGNITIGTAAEDWMGLMSDTMGKDITGPTITAPTFIGGSTTYTVNVSASSSPNPGKDVARALQYGHLGGP